MYNMSPRQSNISLIVANILFGVSYTLIVDLLQGAISYQQLFMLLIFAATAFFVPFAMTHPKALKESLKDAPRLALCAVVTIYGWSFLTLRGGEHTTSLDIAALSTLGPTVTIVAAALQNTRDQKVKHIHPNFIRALTTPLLLLFLVIFIVVGDVKIESSRSQIIGNIWVTIGVISMGVSTVIAKSLHRKYGTLVLLGWYFAIGTLLVPLVIPDWWSKFTDIFATELDLKGKMELALLPILDMIAPMYLLYRGSRNLTPLHTALYRYIQPVIAFIVLVMNSFAHLGTLLPSLKTLAMTLVVTLLLLLLASFIMPRDEVS